VRQLRKSPVFLCRDDKVGAHGCNHETVVTGLLPSRSSFSTSFSLLRHVAAWWSGAAGATRRYKSSVLAGMSESFLCHGR